MINNFKLQDFWVSTRKNSSKLLVTAAEPNYFDCEIWIIDKDGNKLKKLTSNEVRDTYPAFSPCVSMITFRFSRGNEPKVQEEIWRMDADGSNLKRLSYYTQGETKPCRRLYKAGPQFLSPDGI